MKNKKNPFRVRPIRKSWNEKFWKKGTWRTHHTALFAMVLVLGVAFGFDAAFGADVAEPYFNPPAPLVSPLPIPIDADAPSVPSGAPTDPSTVTPKFSGANIQGYVFNQADGDVLARDSILQLYDYTNIWGQLNVINGIVNGGYAGLGVDPYLQGTALESFSPAVVIDDIIDNRAAGIMDTGGGATLGFVSVWDALQIDPLKASPTLGADSSNRIVLINNDFGEADIEFESSNSSPTIWQIGTGKADNPFTFHLDYLDTDPSPDVWVNELLVNAQTNSTTLSQDLSVAGDITASSTITGASVGRFYINTASTATPTITKSVTASCTSGDTRISCSGYQAGSTYIFMGGYPSGPLGCVSASRTTGVANSSALFADAYCFSPDG